MYRRTLDWTNDTGEVVELIYEPDGMPIAVKPGVSVHSSCCGSEEGELEATHSDRGLTVFGWPSSKAEIFIDDVLVYTSPVAMPGLPPGMSTSEFIGGMFGRPVVRTNRGG